jgi:hypothetical protein
MHRGMICNWLYINDGKATGVTSFTSQSQTQRQTVAFQLQTVGGFTLDQFTEINGDNKPMRIIYKRWTIGPVACIPKGHEFAVEQGMRINGYRTLTGTEWKSDGKCLGTRAPKAG